MSVIRSGRAVVVAAVLTSMTAVGAVAQDPGAPAAFTGWALDESHISSAEPTETDDRLQRRDLAYGYDFVTSDPRMTGRAVWTGNGDRFPTDPVFEVQASHWAISNDEGGWLGSGPGIRGTGIGDVSAVVLEGTGAYTGLSAVVFVEWNLGGGNLRGVIFPGPIVAAPEPVEGS